MAVLTKMPPVTATQTGFLFQFTDGGLLGLLAGFDFASRKRPQAGTMLILAPL